ncbi:rhodanese-like domain-containing protein [Nonomuraea helvata]|uniref:Rhodanese-like domain-containing protein n=1 Tax=Nonomuraea helvata TaxID=37484 RepID=A0ABV5SF78_9ACTN
MDVRTPSEFEAAHIPGSRHVPLASAVPARTLPPMRAPTQIAHFGLSENYPLGVLDEMRGSERP